MPYQNLDTVEGAAQLVADLGLDFDDLADLERTLSEHGGEVTEKADAIRHERVERAEPPYTLDSMAQECARVASDLARADKDDGTPDDFDDHGHRYAGR